MTSSFDRSEMLVYRGRHHDVAPEVLVTQWPGGGYTFQAQEVMRCLRAGELRVDRWFRGATRLPWRVRSLSGRRRLVMPYHSRTSSPQEEPQWSG